MSALASIPGLAGWMPQGLALVEPPESEPLTLLEAQTWLRLDHAFDDTTLTALILSARLRAELETNRALVTQTWRMELDAWPLGGEILRPPLQDVTLVQIKDAAGVLSTIDPALYEVGVTKDPGRLRVLAGAPAPGSFYGAVQITFEAGYGLAAAVPDDLKLAMLQLVALWYGPAREGGVNIGNIVNELPQSAMRIFRNYWTGVLG